MSSTEDLNERLTKLLTNLNEKRNEDNRVLEYFHGKFERLSDQFVRMLRNELNRHYVSDEVINERIKLVDNNCKVITDINHKIKFIESKFKQHSIDCHVMSEKCSTDELTERLTKLLTELNEKRNEDIRVLEYFQVKFEQISGQFMEMMRNELNRRYVPNELINERMKVLDNNRKEISDINNKIKFIESTFKQHSNLFDN